MAEFVRNCKFCGTEFAVPNKANNKMYCSDKCRVASAKKAYNERKKLKAEEYKAKYAESNKKKKLTKQQEAEERRRAISDTESRARQNGISYGELTAMEYRNAHPWVRPVLKGEA